MSINLNMDKKLRVGGRKAPQMSIEDFKILLDAWLLSANRSESDYAERLYDTLTIGEAYYAGKVIRDIKKINVDFENVIFRDVDGIKIGPNGVPFIWFMFGGDWELPVWGMIYWDGKDMRGYVPTYGNTFNASMKAAYGSDETDGPVKLKYWEHGTYKEKWFDDSDDCLAWLGQEVEVEPNVDACIKDFSSRVTPTAKITPEEIQKTKEKLAKARDKADEDS